MQMKLQILFLIWGISQFEVVGQTTLHTDFRQDFHGFYEAEKLFFHRQFDSAVIVYKRLLKIATPEQYPTFKAKCLLRIANAFMSGGSVDSAGIFLHTAKSLIEKHKIHHDDLLAETYYIQGHLRYIFNETDSADFFLNRALSYCGATSKDSLPVLITKDFGNIDFSLYRYDEALAHYETALNMEKSRKQPSELIISSLYQNMSLVYANKFEYANASAYFKTSLEIKEKLLKYDDLLLIHAYLNYSMLLSEIGYLQKAMELSHHAERLINSRFQKDHYLLGHIYHDRSLILVKLGKRDQAIIYLEKAIEQYSINYPGNYAGQNNVYLTLGLFLYEQGNFERAFEYLKKVDQGNSDARVQILSNLYLALCSKKNGNTGQTEFYFLNSIRILKCLELEFTNVGSFTYQTLGNHYYQLKDYEQAEVLLLKGYKISTNEINSNHFLNSVNNLAYFYLYTHDNNNALKYFQLGINNYYDSLNHFKNPNNSEKSYYPENTAIINTMQGKALALYNLFVLSSSNISYLTESIETSLMAINLLERQKIIEKGGSSYFNIVGNNDFIYELGLNANYQLYFITGESKYLEEPFTIIEKSKGSNLRISINSLDAIEFSNIPLESAYQEKNLRSSINFYNHKIESIESNIKADDSIFINHYKNLRFESIVKYDSLIEFLENQYPDYYALKYETESPAIESIQAKLDEKSALLDYFVSDTNLFIAVVTTDDYYLRKVSIDTIFHKNSMNYYKQIKKAGNKEIIINLSNLLYSKLIEPIESLLKTKETLIVIPDHCLHYIPFETLCKNHNPSEGQIKFSELDYLIKKYSISYHYSATLWLRGIHSAITGKKPRSDSLRFIGFAPVFSNNSLSVPKNHHFLADSSSSEAGLRSVTINGKTFNRLPYSRTEVESISELFKAHGYEGRYLMDNEASEKAFKEQIKNYDIIHIATHAFSDDEKPEFSGMVFSQPQETERSNVAQCATNATDLILYNDQGNDGILHAGEMYNLGISADLVVLSACETGIGKLVKGEGVIAMTRGLIYSGSNNILYTLWKISDKHTQNFMFDFYSHLMDGASYNQALRHAKLKMISNESTAFPALWSGYMLIGQ